MTIKDAGKWVGQVVAQKYALQKWLGTGRFGPVFQADQVVSGQVLRTVALRLLRPAPQLLATLTEAIDLSHLQILRAYDAGEAIIGGETFLYSAMELADEALSDTLERYTLEPGEARDLATQIASALTYLHNRGLVHGDVRPANVLWLDSGWKLADYGIQRTLSSITPRGTRSLIASSRYIPPEAYEGIVSPAWDIWSFGTMLSEALTEREPRESTDVAGPSGRPRRGRGRSLPSPFEQIVANCLNPDLHRRWTATQLSDFLKIAWSGGADAAESAPPAPSPEEQPPPPEPAVEKPREVDPSMAQTQYALPSPFLRAARARRAEQTAAQPEHVAPVIHPPAVRHEPAAPPVSEPVRPHQEVFATPSPPVTAVPEPVVVYQTPAPVTSFPAVDAPEPVSEPVVPYTQPVAVPVPPPGFTGQMPQESAPAQHEPHTPEPFSRQQWNPERPPWRGQLLNARAEPERKRSLPNLSHTDWMFLIVGAAAALVVLAFFLPRGESRNVSARTPVVTSDNKAATPPESTPRTDERPGPGRDQEAIRTVIDRWINSTRERDVEAHTSLYAPQVKVFYRKRNLTHEQIRRQIQWIFSQVSTVNRLEVKNLKFDQLTDDSAVVSFDKDWDTRGRRRSAGSVRQRLTLVNVDGQWRITGEEDRRVYRRAG